MYRININDRSISSPQVGTITMLNLLFGSLAAFGFFAFGCVGSLPFPFAAVVVIGPSVVVLVAK